MRLGSDGKREKRWPSMERLSKWRGFGLAQVLNCEMHCGLFTTLEKVGDVPLADVSILPQSGLIFCTKLTIQRIKAKREFFQHL